MADCCADWTNVVPHCAHGPLFRCAADALYVRYADIDAVGVCGDAPDLGDWAVSSSETLVGDYTEWSVSGAEPSGIQKWVLAIRCTNGTDLQVSAWYHYTDDDRFGQHGVGMIDYHFGGQSQPKRVEAGNSDRNDDNWIMGDPSGFLADMSADTTGTLYLGLVSSNFLPSAGGGWSSWGDGTPTTDVEAKLRTTGYRAHIQPHVVACTSS